MASRNGTSDEGNVDVCNRCLGIDWEAIALSQPQESPIMELPETHEELSNSKCRICRILATIKPSSFDGTSCSAQTYSARAMSYSIGSKSSNLRDSILLGVNAQKESPFIGITCSSLDSDFGIRKIQANAIDFDVLKECWHYCRDRHDVICDTTTADVHPTERPNIRVIDCNSPTFDIIAASQETQYAALSYVWGNPSPPRHSPFSQIVEDAIKATLAMGLEYLWVDQYCINQDDDADKRDQISKMDIIYSHAAITFINATRESQKHGLPGISTISRIQQLQETLNNVTFVQCFPDISTMVKASPWCTRGWTFQEGFFAPRRIIFTEYGTSYLCHRMHCIEWKRQPVNDIFSESLTPLKGIVPMAADMSTETLQLKIDWNSAADWVPEYTKRKFTYSSDALNACRGILNYFRGSESPAYSIWGVPIPYVTSGSYVFELGWRHDSPATRRDAFPSWSFLGWQGPVTTGTIRVLPETLYLGDYQEPFLEIKDVERELGDRRVLQEENDCRLRYLHFKSKVIYLSLIHNDWTTEQMNHRTAVRYATLQGIKTETFDLIPAGTHASLRLASNLYMLTYAYYDRKSLECSGNIGVNTDPLIRDWGLLWAWFGVRFLILENHGGLYERVGVTNFSLRSDPDTRVAFTNAAGELLEKVDLATVLPYFLTEAEERTVVIS